MPQSARHFGEAIAAYGRACQPLRPNSTLAATREMWKEPIVLEDHPDLSIAQRLVNVCGRVEQGLSAHGHSPGIGPSEPRDQPQHGGLPRSRRPEKDAGLAAQFEREIEREQLVDFVDHTSFKG